MRGSVGLYMSGFWPWRTPIGVIFVAVAAADDAVDELDARVDDIARHENYCSRWTWTILVVVSWIVGGGWTTELSLGCRRAWRGMIALK